MPKKIVVSDLPEFDLATQLKSEADIAAYITMVIEEGDAAELAHALGVAARARGMAEIAEAAGLTREASIKPYVPEHIHASTRSAEFVPPLESAWLHSLAIRHAPSPGLRLILAT